MPDIKTDGVVLRAVNYRESDRMLTLLSPSAGRMDAIARGCRKPTSRLLAASQPFASGEFIFHEREGRLSVRSALVRDAFFPIASDYDILQNAAYCAGWCLKAIMPNQASEDLFNLMLTVLTHFAYGNERPGRITAVFLVRYASLEGIAPSVERCAVCGAEITGDPRWLPTAGGCVCVRCHPEAPPIGDDAWRALRACLNGTFFEDIFDIFRSGIPDGPLRKVRALMMRFLDANL